MDTQRAQFPFTGLHVYQRTQEAWSRARLSTNEVRLQRRLETEVRLAVFGIARATALSSQNNRRTLELEDARGSIHAAGAIADQLAQPEAPVDEGLPDLLIDAARMLGALIRTLRATQEGEPVPGDNYQDRGIAGIARGHRPLRGAVRFRRSIDVCQNLIA